MDKELENIRIHILEQIDMSRDIEDNEIQRLISEAVSQYSKMHRVSIEQRIQYEKEIFYSLRKLGVIQELVEDMLVTEIMVNGTQQIFYESQGKIFPWDKTFDSKESLDDVIQQMVGSNNRMVNVASPIVDTRLKNGARVNIVLHPIAVDGAAISIRKFPESPMTMTQLVQTKTISQEVVDFLGILVQAGYNIFISGGTGSGKTTFLNALSEYIPGDERLITIEDSAELQIMGIANLVRLETRNASMEGVQEISMRDLIRTALRMRPDRIIVGECRGAEALDMLQAMNTGHDGSISTGHANSCTDMLSRLETMVLMGMELPISAIRGQIASGIDILIHLGRLRDKSRKVLEVAEIAGIEAGNIQIRTLYQFVEEKSGQAVVEGSWRKVAELANATKLCAAGLRVNKGRTNEL